MKSRSGRVDRKFLHNILKVNTLSSRQLPSRAFLTTRSPAPNTALPAAFKAIRLAALVDRLAILAVKPTPKEPVVVEVYVATEQLPTLSTACGLKGTYL